MRKLLIHKWNKYWESQSIQDGEDFEDFVADEFFPDNLYEMLHRTHSFEANRKRFIRSSMNPDFQFEIRDTNMSFWVECKHRKNITGAALINVFKDNQLQRYQSFKNTFLLLCTYQLDEQYMYFIPVKHIKWDNLYISFLRPYELTLDPPIMPGLIRKYLASGSK